MIWFNKNLTIDNLGNNDTKTLGNHLGMVLTEIGTDFLKMKMPVDDRTKQPYGLLHGGASVALAETIGSIGSFLIVNPLENICVGMEINANHLHSVKDGFVIATAMPLHIGSTSHIWDIKIRDENNHLICVSRLTVAILKKR